MPGIFWLLYGWGSAAVFVLAVLYRTAAIARLPVHLRWELAPIPHEKGKGKYGGSYLENYEWWKERRDPSWTAPVTYMAKEILFMRGVWRHNRSLWPFSFALHMGIYLLIGGLFLNVVSLAPVAAHHGGSFTGVCLKIASAFSYCACALGTAGTSGLLLKRLLDPNLAWSNSLGTFLNLLFLEAVFVSGGYAWFSSTGTMAQTNLFIKGLLSFDRSITPPPSLGAHAILFLSFCMYLPFSGMLHFVAKYFMYHSVRWNDRPGNMHMERKLGDLLSQSVTWGAEHAGGHGQKSWEEITREEA
jgi:nitrate reductase gamma subunit